MNFSDYKIIAVVGPTAVGKTKYAIELAKEINGEIINGDATQVYKELNIGSAKVTKQEMDGVVHHLIDIKDPSEEYTVADFQKDARAMIETILKKGKVPIICGGSGLYIQSVLYNYRFDTKFDKEKSKYFNYNDTQIIEEYQKLFPLNEDNLDINNPSRLRNYLIRDELGIEEEKQGQQPFYDNFIIIGLTCERANLHQRINMRVDQMLEAGLVDEVKQFNRDYSSQKAIGYKEIHQYLAGEISLERSAELIKRNTRRFAKRQYTWFNNKMDVHWYDVEDKKWQ